MRKLLLLALLFPAVAHAQSSVKIWDGAQTANVTGTALDVNVAAGTVTVTEPVTVDNAGTFAVQAAQSGAWNITNITGTVSLPTGASTLAEQQTQTTSLSVLDDWDESDRAKVNPIVGQAGIEGGAGASTALTTRVAIATDANTISGTVTTVEPSVTSATTLNVSNSASNFTVVASNASRKGLILVNDSSTICRVKFGATASGTSYTLKFFAQDEWVMTPPTYTGIVDAICDAATGNIRGAEL